MNAWSPPERQSRSPTLEREPVASLLAAALFEVSEFLLDQCEMARWDKPQDFDHIALVDTRQPVAFRDVRFVQAGLGMPRPLPGKSLLMGLACPQ